MKQIIIKLIEFFLNPRLIPSQRDPMSQKIFLILITSVFENTKCGINGRQASHLLFKYNVSNWGGGSKVISIRERYLMLALCKNKHSAKWFSYSWWDLLNFWQVCWQPINSLVSFTRAMNNILSVSRFQSPLFKRESDLYIGGNESALLRFSWIWSLMQSFQTLTSL